MRRSSLLLGTVLLGLAPAPVPQPPASASCAAPYLVDVEDLVLQRGTAVTIEGEAFVDGCQDLGSCQVGVGCDDDSCSYGPEPEPMEDVTLRLVQDGREWELGTVDAGADGTELDGRVSWEVEVPAGVAPGRARLVADSAAPVPVRIR